MLNQQQSHCEYQKDLIAKMSSFSSEIKTNMQDYSLSIQKLYLLNLDPVYSIIKPRYSHTGRPARNQLGILRSLMLMCFMGIISITNWAATVRNSSFLTSICGFESNIAPSHNSYYDFINRLWGESYSSYKKRKNSPHDEKFKPNAKLKKNEKYNKERSGITEKLRVQIENNQFTHFSFEFILQLIFVHIAVIPSARMGLLGDTQNIDTAADGTAVYSGGSPFGMKKCNCKENGLPDCDCKYFFSDVDATWGWDSHLGKYYFGSTLFLLSTTYNKHDLPLLFMTAQAQRHDSILGIISILRFQQFLPDFKMGTFIADSAMDNYATYTYLADCGINPIIALNDHNKDNTDPQNSLPDGVDHFELNRPVCKGGLPMTNWGITHKGRKFRCPLACKDKLLSAPCRCSDSDYGRVIYVREPFDLRMITPIPRNSASFKKLFNKRTAAERTNKRLLKDYKVEFSGSRSNKHRSFRTFLGCVGIHLDLWVRKEPPNDLILALAV